MSQHARREGNTKRFLGIYHASSPDCVPGVFEIPAELLSDRPLCLQLLVHRHQLLRTVRGLFPGTRCIVRALRKRNH